MKLITRININILTILVGVFIIGSIAFFFIIRSTIISSVDERLYFQKEQFIKQGSQNSLPAFLPLTGEKIFTTETTPGTTLQAFIKDTSFYESGDKEVIPYRMIVFPLTHSNKLYRITIADSLIETDDLAEGIFYATGIIFLLLIISLFTANYFTFKKILSSFYISLSAIKSFQFNSNGNALLPKTSITEFNELNAILLEMQERIYQDFISLKEFTENASHEIQTPIAVIKSKLELLLQSENIGEGDLRLIQDANEMAGKLSRITQALLLLTKIENRQFDDRAVINLKDIIIAKIELFKEFIEMRQLYISSELSDAFIHLNPALADILVNNLLSNAIRHNATGGIINISLDSTSLRIENSGIAPDLPAEKLFGRFVKGSASHESVGLGLSIVEKICSLYGIELSYEYLDNMHIVKLRLPSH